ncbi:hypothetical protein HMPREF9999_00507 [Alloprevotella sp. oral taxon 473 str. F0040]|nr:hypothetical protein HMPREF9999_00507 [Alloprevotella sp. oral taxon 473 str. F0040]
MSSCYSSYLRVSFLLVSSPIREDTPFARYEKEKCPLLIALERG